jgi:hypothetical protein
MRVALSVILILVGVVWVLQGTGVIQSDSFMTGSSAWVVIGAGAILTGVALMIIRRR